MPKTKTPAEQRAELQRELEENNQEIARLEHKQEQLDHQMTRAKNTLSYMNAKERKARTHRLIQKGGVIEHHVPETKDLTEPEFYELMEKIFALPEAKRLTEAMVNHHRMAPHG